MPSDFHDHVLRAGLRILAWDPDQGLQVAELPTHHRDPFDRLLIAQARSERLTLVSAAPRFAAYDVPLVGATAAHLSTGGSWS